ncbi:hypothetical protein PCH70_03080 [Pseudomonas cichorii JBC1]|nr:hypothetical protein PCH70_03080 [Pseudomonas cichorii JBC1]
MVASAGLSSARYLKDFRLWNPGLPGRARRSGCMLQRQMTFGYICILK